MSRTIGCRLTERVAAVARDRPGAPATQTASGTVTYRDLWDAALGWSERLSAPGPPRRSAAAIVADRPADLPAAFLGARLAGLVPLLVDPLLPRDRRGVMLRKARPAILAKTSSAPEVAAVAVDPLVLGEPAGYVVFTSGTQGDPKGIVGNADGLMNFLDWEASLVGLGSRARVPLLTSPSFDVVLREMFLPIVTGGVLCVPAPSLRVSPHRVVPWLAESGANIVHAVPSLSLRWLGSPWPERLAEVSWLIFAGEPLYSQHARRWRLVAPHAAIVNLYGPSETTLAAFCHVLDEPPPAGLQPVGRGLPGVRLLASGSGEPPGRKIFQVEIETPHGSLGYLPGSSAAAANPPLTRVDGITSFVTQDRGRLDDCGRLVIEGRLDTLVKRNGVLVDLGDIEAKAAAIDGVGQACCVQVDREFTGDVLLAVAVEPGLARSDLIKSLSTALGPAMPNDVLMLDRLPLLPNGKADRSRVIDWVGARRGP